jgi:hypothetical protein
MSASNPYGSVPSTTAYSVPTTGYIPFQLPQRRPLWKTILVGMFLAYSPLAILLVVGMLLLGTTSPNRAIASVSSGASVFGVVVLIFAYLTAGQIALIYVDRRDDPSRYSFWRAVGSTLLLYFVILLPIFIIGIIAVGVAVQASR